MAVPYTFGNATTSIPLSQLDTNFATAITLGNTAIQLGNTVTTLNNMTLANVTISSGNTTVTSETISGNLTFTGTGNRITGDFSNATQSNRVAFQTSTANSATALTVLPNGTATQASINLFDNSDPTNAGTLNLLSNATEKSINATITGTGTYLPMTFKTGGSERMRIDTSGNVGIGTTSPGALLETSATNANVYSAIRMTNTTGTGTTAGAAIEWARAGTVKSSIQANTFGNDYMAFCVNGNTERMRIDTSGNLLVGTTTASQKLTVNGDASINTIRVGLGPNSVATNTVFGYQALNSNTTGSQQTVVGYQAGYSISTTSNLVAVGYQAGYSLNSGGDSVFVGTQAGYSMTSPFNSVAIGYQALYSCSTGADNVCIGANAGRSITAYSNIMIGYSAGYNSVAYTTGNNNIVIGWNSRGSAAGNTNEIVFGSNIAGKGTNTGFISPGGGGVYQGNNSSSWSTTSDQRIKENVNPIYSAVSILQQLNPVTFDYILTKKSDAGFIAQEYQQVLPDQVHEHSASEEEKELTGSDTLYGITPNLLPYLVAAIKELKAELDTLKGTK